MKLITYNVLADCTRHHFPDPEAPVLKREHRTPLILAFLRDACADIVCLQEVDKALFGELQQGLDTAYVSSLALNRDGRFGCAMFVKGPDVAWETLNFADDSGRTAQTATIDGVTVANVHLDFKRNCDQMRALVNTLPSSCVVCGDFNASPNSATVRIAQQAGFATLPTGPTANTNGRAKVIDFVFARGSEKVRSVRAAAAIGDKTVLPSATQGSDHVALIAEIL